MGGRPFYGVWNISWSPRVWLYQRLPPISLGWQVGERVFVNSFSLSLGRDWKLATHYGGVKILAKGVLGACKWPFSDWDPIRIETTTVLTPPSPWWSLACIIHVPWCGDDAFLVTKIKQANKKHKHWHGPRGYFAKNITSERDCSLATLSDKGEKGERKAASQWVHPIKTSALQLHCRCFRQRVERFRDSWCNAYNHELHKCVLSL